MDLDPALFHRLYPRVLRYCVRLVGDRDEAEDVAQEAFVRMVRHEVEGPEDAVRVWLFRTALNQVRDRSRVRKNRERLLEENPDPVTPAPPSTPADDAERSERRKRVRRALDELDERGREILLMRQEGFKYREIADAVGVATSSVGTLLARAQQRFADAYDTLGDDDDASQRR